MFGQLDALRFEPTEKRIRARWNGQTVVDSRRALLVWEPMRVVPTYAVPIEHVVGAIGPDSAPEPSVPPGTAPMGAPQLSGRPVLDPSVPFTVHTTEGVPSLLRGEDGRAASGFLPTDPDLAGYVLLDFDAFDEWLEEDEINVSHPRDPFHRVDVLHSSRKVRIELDGVVLAESSTPCTLFEPPLPVRHYLPTGDVRTELLQPSETVTYCAYKGRATYWSLEGEADVAWTYREPLRDASEVAGRIAFFDERVDVIVDGERLDRPVTPWSRRPS
jgi:uncharacterized protein (DUF427 family)